MIKRTVVLKDFDNKDKTVEIGEPFLSDGTFWVTIRIGREVLPRVRIDNKEINKLFRFLEQKQRRKVRGGIRKK